MSSLQAIPSPEERLKRLEKAGTDLKLDKKIPIRRFVIFDLALLYFSFRVLTI